MPRDIGDRRATINRILKRLGAIGRIATEVARNPHQPEGWRRDGIDFFVAPPPPMSTEGGTSRKGSVTVEGHLSFAQWGPLLKAFREEYNQVEALQMQIPAQHYEPSRVTRLAFLGL